MNITKVIYISDVEYPDLDTTKYRKEIKEIRNRLFDNYIKKYNKLKEKDYSKYLVEEDRVWGIVETKISERKTKTNTKTSTNTYHISIH